MSLTRSSTDSEIITAYIQGANFYDISDATAISIEEVARIIQDADDAGKLTEIPTEKVFTQAPQVTPTVEPSAPTRPIDTPLPPVPAAPAPEVVRQPVVSDPTVPPVVSDTQVQA